jgi:hypothetical protein
MDSQAARSEIPRKARGDLVDGFGRVASDLRVSVTDRCNFRCRYCMPPEGLPWMPRHELLSYEEIQRVARVLVECGQPGHEELVPVLELPDVSAAPVPDGSALTELLVLVKSPAQPARSRAAEGRLADVDDVRAWHPGPPQHLYGHGGVSPLVVPPAAHC